MLSAVRESERAGAQSPLVNSREHRKARRAEERALTQTEFISPHTPRENYQKAPAPQYAAQKEADAAPRQTPLILDMPPAPPNPTQTGNPQQDPVPRWKSWRIWKRILQTSVAIVGVGYAVITYLQWHDAHHNFTLDERAWIEVKSNNTGSNLSDYKGAYTKVILLNFGKSPALNIRIRSAGEILPANTPPSLLYGRGLGGTTGVLFPGVALPDTPSVPRYQQVRQVYSYQT